MEKEEIQSIINMAMKKKRKNKLEFSKQLVLLVTLTYFFGVIIGSFVVVVKSPDQLGVYLAFIGTPTATTIGFYCWKAKAENQIKLGKLPTESEENI